MGCCGKNNKKLKNKNNLNQIEKKKSLINEEKKIVLNDSIPEKLIEPNIHQEFIENTTKYQKQISVISFSDDNIEEISSTDNITSIKTFHDLQTFVKQNNQSISIIFFYAHYCPYSKRTIPDLRQWARINKDRIFLYEVDIEQASNLAEYYHIRTIPTIMAFEDKNLLAPIWQRTANNVLSSSIDKNESLEKSHDNTNNLSFILNPSYEISNSIELLNQIEQEQNLIILDKKSNEIFSSIDESNTSLSKSITLSEQNPYIWDESIDNISEKTESKELIFEYKGRMISQSIISNNDYLKKKRTWNEYFDDNKSIHEDQQYIHLPNSNEIFYQKQYENLNEFNYSLSLDRFSTLTYQDMKDKNQQEDICILYHGPNRYRGFEDNLPNKRINSSKLSLLTLKSHLLLSE